MLAGAGSEEGEAMTVTRVTMRPMRGGASRSFVIPDGPIPKVGDICTLKGVEYSVERVKKVKSVASFRVDSGKLRQVVP